MSFAVPTWVLWLQAAYSLWTFLRNAKFFRIPFISMSMLWHGHDRTWFKRRKYLLLDGRSREGGGDWQDYDNQQEKDSHSFSIENNYDMRFQLNNNKYRFCASFETGKPLKFLHFAKNYHIAIEDIVLMGKYHLVTELSYYKRVDKFMVVRGCEIPLEATTASLPEDDEDVNLPEHQEIKMNLNTFVVQTEMVDAGYYNITITDSNNYRETRMFLPLNMTREIIKYLKYCKETNNYPFRDLSPYSVHVVNPIKAMVDGVFEWVLTVQLRQEVRLFFH